MMVTLFLMLLISVMLAGCGGGSGSSSSSDLSMGTIQFSLPNAPSTHYHDGFWSNKDHSLEYNLTLTGPNDQVITNYGLSLASLRALEISAQPGTWKAAVQIVCGVQRDWTYGTGETTIIVISGLKTTATINVTEIDNDH